MRMEMWTNVHAVVVQKQAQQTIHTQVQVVHCVHTVYIDNVTMKCVAFCSICCETQPRKQENAPIHTAGLSTSVPTVMHTAVVLPLNTPRDCPTLTITSSTLLRQ